MPDGAVTRLMEKSGSADEQERQLTKPERGGLRCWGRGGSFQDGRCWGRDRTRTGWRYGLQQPRGGEEGKRSVGVLCVFALNSCHSAYFLGELQFDQWQGPCFFAGRVFLHVNPQLGFIGAGKVRQGNGW